MARDNDKKYLTLIIGMEIPIITLLFALCRYVLPVQTGTHTKNCLKDTIWVSSITTSYFVYGRMLLKKLLLTSLKKTQHKMLFGF